MSITESGRTHSAETRVGDHRTDTFRTPRFRETKPSFMTTELWAMVIGLVALVVIYNASHDASLNLWRASVLATTLAVAYIVSRGVATSGTRDPHPHDDARRHSAGRL